MALNSLKRKLSVLILMVLLCLQVDGKTSEEKTNNSAEIKSPHKTDLSGLLFADELKQVIERYMFGVCPQPYKVLGSKKNSTAPACDLDTDQQELAARLATLALRAHAAARADCSRFGAALANTLGELARSASNRQVLAAAASDNKKRKLSKSQKKQIQAKQRTALAVKKKAAAVAAAAAAKVAATAS